MRLLFILICIMLPVEVIAQFLPGMDQSQVGMHMEETFREFVLRNPPNVDELDFLKYEHISGDKTLLVFMTECGICSFTRLMVDIGYLKETVDMYNREYQPAGENMWTVKREEYEYIVSLDQSEWLFTVTVRLKGGDGMTE